MRQDESMTYFINGMALSSLKKVYISNTTNAGLCNYAYTFTSSIYIPALTIQLYDTSKGGYPIVGSFPINAKSVGDEVEIIVGKTSQLSASYTLSESSVSPEVKKETKDTRYVIKAMVTTRLTERTTLIIETYLPYHSTVTSPVSYKITGETIRFPVEVPARGDAEYSSYAIELAYVVHELLRS
jgi:hypothetical protein